MAGDKQLGNIVYQVEMDVAQLIAAQQKVNQRLDQMDGSFNKSSQSAGRFEGALNKVGLAIAGAFTIETARRLIEIGDQMNTLQARVARLSPSVDAAKESMKALSAIASQTGNSLSDTERLWETLTSALKETGATNSQILSLTDTLQKIGTIGGSSSEEMANALRQFGQSISSGIVQASEFNSVIEQMPELARTMAAGLGISTGQLRKRMLEGKLTAQDALNAIQKQSESVNAEFDKMPVSIDRAKNSLDVAFKNAISDLNQAIGLTSTLAGLMQNVADNLNYYNNNAGDAGRMPKLIELQKKYNDELKEGRKWYDFSDKDWEIRRGQAAFELKRVEQEIASIRAKAANEAKNNQGFKSASTNVDDAATAKLIKNSERRLALAKREGEARARLQAQYDAADAGITDQKRVKALQDEYAETYRVTEARKESNKEGKQSASQAESIAQKLEALKQQSQLAADSTGEMSREQAMLNAELSLGKGATQAQIQQARQYAATKWDTANAIKAQAAAEKLLPEARENASYKQDVQDLNTALAAKKITQEQYNQTIERLEANHQATLAKIRAQAVVSPQQEAVAQVNPVQQLANENAQKLALIKQFEQQSLLSHQQAMELRNATDMQYEQQRINAQWEIYRNQSEINQLAASAIDSLQGGATNAITGLVNGTQNLQEAFANIGTTILGSVVGGLVEMGIQWVKSQIMGQAAAAASLASTMAQATAAASAWAPAAISASIATYGSAAAVGQTAYAGSLLAAKGMAVAGAREHGGPVSANSMYRVGEGGKPEIYQANNGNQYMIPGDNGRVISNRDMKEGGGGNSFNPVMNLTINTTGGIDNEDIARLRKAWNADMLRMMVDQSTRPGGLLQGRKK
ncbi:tape measure protein [Cronobacter turicensis]|uniref:tape measure protein n=1 Tax=Cronobacter turicensis TaxID=413502 RepID=UPI001D62AE54|nr:tape measure protein [Cronobacter turicensis]EGT4490691.1 phage tail tape measure protein [Cronobacter turicensis]MDI6417457.1 tape measure protein [Cronobacter turicensis]MDI6463954.1 tape measure protein [Cronobacter turicensis]MDI7673281.1 tape measure protein [Cronobacter turicensis]